MTGFVSERQLHGDEIIDDFSLKGSAAQSSAVMHVKQCVARHWILSTIFSFDQFNSDATLPLCLRCYITCLVLCYNNLLSI